jgi:hypothetical protein
METYIAIFWVVVGLLVLLLRLTPTNPISRVAFTWMGPTRVVGEKWSHYQFRWAAYSASWFAQILVLFSLLWVTARVWPAVAEMTWWQVFWFALPLGAGMAGLALIGFLLKGLKARYIGPDDTLEAPLERSSAV